MTDGIESETNGIAPEVTLLPCPFCGGEAELYSTVPTYDSFWSCICRDCGASTSFGGEAEAIAAWNARAEDAEAEMAQRIQSLELECAKLQEELRKAGNRGRLTAEQVRKAVMSADRWEKPMGNTGLTNTHLIIRDDGWHAIADELNAALGGGECELVYGENDDGVDGWYTHCGGWFAATRKDRRLVHPGFCQLCGKRCVYHG